MIKIALIAEGDIEAVTHVETKPEAEAFCSGFNWGGNCYGAGSSFGIPEYDLADFAKDGWYDELIPEVELAFKGYKPE